MQAFLASIPTFVYVVTFEMKREILPSLQLFDLVTQTFTSKFTGLGALSFLSGLGLSSNNFINQKGFH